jgi:hypothetical protein
MMLDQLLLLHLMAGVGVAVAVYLTSRSRRRSERWFGVLTALVFWPLYLPLLLARRGEPRRGAAPQPAAGQDELAVAIAQVDAELEGALQSLGGWAEDVLARERDRLGELRGVWTTQAERIREMDRLLARPEYGEAAAAWVAGPLGAEGSARLRHSQEVIQQNLDRLRQVRERALLDLLGTLAWVRELVSMIHLARFTGAPAARAEELVAQIAAAVDGLASGGSPDASRLASHVVDPLRAYGPGRPAKEARLGPPGDTLTDDRVR